MGETDRGAGQVPANAFISLQVAPRQTGAPRAGGAPEWNGGDLNRLVDLAEVAEQSGVAYILIGEPDSGDAAEVPPDLFILAAAATGATRHIGIVVGARAAHRQPYYVARKLSSIDRLGGGRAGWSIVVPAGVSRAKSAEFASVVLGLWDTWDDDAVVADKARGVFFDACKVRPLDHRGAYYAVRGPLNSSRSRQGRPVLIERLTPGDNPVLTGGDLVHLAAGSLEAARGWRRANGSRRPVALEFVLDAPAGEGELFLSGSDEAIAGRLIEIFHEGLADGFAIRTDDLARARVFLANVPGKLREAGVIAPVRDETLRDRLKLPAIARRSQAGIAEVRA